MAYMKRNLKSKKIGDLIYDFLESSKNKKPANFKDLWKKVVGEKIFSETANVRFKNNILYVHFQNPYLKADILTYKHDIMKKIKLLNSNIHDLVFD